MKRFLRFIPLCITCLYPSIAMASSGDLGAGLGAIFIEIFVVILFLLSSILFISIPYFHLKAKLSGKRFPYWFHYLFCTLIAMPPFIFIAAAVLKDLQLPWGLLSLLPLLIGFLFYPGIHKLITYCINQNASKAIKTLHTLTKIAYILCSLLSLLAICICKEFAIAIFIFTIITLTIAWIIQNKMFKKLNEMLPSSQ